MDDPFTRPTLDDLRAILEGIDKSTDGNVRDSERLDLSVPAEAVTLRGNTVSTMTREISRTGLGLLHRGMLEPGEATVRMASDTREFEYRIQIEWCRPCDNDMYMSGCRFLARPKSHD